MTQTKTKTRTFLRNFSPMFLIFISLSASTEEQLIFATHTSPPLSLYLEEVMQEALRPYSIAIKVLKMPGSRVISQVNNGQIDGDLSRVMNLKKISDADTSNYLLVNEPIVSTEIVVITLAKKAIASPISWQSINQGKVAFLRGSKTIRKYLDIESRVAVFSNIQVLEMVANQRVDSAIMFAPVAQHLLNQSPRLKEKLIVQSPAVLSFYLFSYLNKKHVKLIPKLEFSLRQLKRSGFLDNLANKYQVTAAGALMQSSVNPLREINAYKPTGH